MRKLWWLLVLVIGLMLGKDLAAKPGFQAANVFNPATGEKKQTVVLPSRAVEVAPNLFYLGTAIDKGRRVEGYARIDVVGNQARPGTECGNGVCEPGENVNKCPADCGGGLPNESSCYGFLSKGARWRVNEEYVFNPSNTRGLDGVWLVSNFESNAGKWQTAAGVNILGQSNSSSATLTADLDMPDGENEIYFADIDSPGAIGITIVWGVFSGPPSKRELVEWDQVYDDVDFNWSNSGESEKMDFENIATHELGHTVGLDDLYTSGCSEETMYGYADFGETSKRSLEAGDITGVKELYQ